MEVKCVSLPQEYPYTYEVHYTFYPERVDTFSYSGKEHAEKWTKEELITYLFDSLYQAQQKKESAETELEDLRDNHTKRAFLLHQCFDQISNLKKEIQIGKSQTKESRQKDGNETSD